MRSTRHKPISKKWFVVAAGVCLLIAMFQAWRDENDRAEKLNGDNKTLTAQIQALEQKNSELTNQLIANEGPIILQPTPNKEIEALLKRQDEELSKLKGQVHSPKRRALQVSRDLLKFLEDRGKVQPSFSPPPGATTKEDWMKAQNTYAEATATWERESLAQARTQFAVPVAEVIEDMKAENINAGRLRVLCEFYAGNTYSIQECATDMGVLASKLSH